MHISPYNSAQEPILFLHLLHKVFLLSKGHIGSTMTYKVACLKKTSFAIVYGFD